MMMVSMACSSELSREEGILRSRRSGKMLWVGIVPPQGPPDNSTQATSSSTASGLAPHAPHLQPPGEAGRVPPISQLREAPRSKDETKCGT